MTRVATCPSCGDVLVMTMAWRGFEFVCLSCGNLWDFVQPRGADETPERWARIEATKAEWQELSAGLLSGGAMLRACADAGGRCSSEPHLHHASAEEAAAHNAAVARIGERLGRRLPLAPDVQIGFDPARGEDTTVLLVDGKVVGDVVAPSELGGTDG